METNDKLDEDFSEIQESDDTDWKSETTKLREKAIRQRDKTKELRGSIKTLEEKVTELEKPKSSKPDEQLYKRLDSMALKMAGIEAADEIELFTKWKDRTKMEADEVIGEKIFQAQLADIRQAKANAAATDIKGGDGKDTGEKGTPEYWIGKATKDSSGELLFPDDLPNDFKLRAAIFDKLAAQGKGQDKKFYNSK